MHLESQYGKSMQPLFSNAKAPPKVPSPHPDQSAMQFIELREEQQVERIGRHREMSAGPRGPGGDSHGRNERLERSLHSKERQAYVALRDKSRSRSGPHRGEAPQEASTSFHSRFSPKTLSPEYAQSRKALYDKDPRHDRDDLRQEYIKRDIQAKEYEDRCQSLT